MKYYNTVKTFLTKGLWNVDVKKLPRLKRFGYSFLRVLIIAIRGFQEDHCTLQASALTYITLVSLVPILAITLAFCKGIGLQRKLIETIGLERSVQIVRDDNGRIRREISYRVLAADPEQEDGLKTGAAMDAQGNAETPDAPVIVIADPGASDATIVAAIETESPAAEGIAATEEEASRGIDNPEFPGNASQEPTPVPFHRHPHYAAQLPEAMQTALVSIFTYVDKTNFAALGLIGIAALLFSVLSAIRKLEDNFNAIWCVKKGRNLLQQFSQYLIVLLLFPIVTLLAISASAFAHSGGLAEMLHSSSPIVIMLGHYGGNLLMFLFLLGGFVFLYFFMPNTRVRLAPAFFGGLLGSLAWLGVLYVYLRWQVGLAKFNAIYGGFAALPFFLAWLYTSWIVVLLGAEFT
ncbi:MAG: YihY/virulence factor BrkB family protein, partial [Victivallales bacterium]|nr:YihY/virulence factor BrkB family protein [Victivallales bacterium]